MDELTRIKKYESLRESMNVKTNDVIETPKLSRFAKRLKNIDSAYFQPIYDQIHESATKDQYTASIPLRAKTEEQKRLEVDDATPLFDENEILARALRLSNQKDSNNDDVLNQFLQEIRSYNMKQGVRSQEDTRMEILKQLRVESEVQDKTAKATPMASDTIQRMSIARQVKEMIEQSNHEEDPAENSRKQSYQDEFDQERMQRQRLLEETQQLRLQLHEHEEELDEIGTGMDYTRKLLNLLVGLLLITVFIAGAILTYLVMNR